MEYAATVTVNPLTALRMLQDFVQLNSGNPSLSVCDALNVCSDAAIDLMSYVTKLLQLTAPLF